MNGIDVEESMMIWAISERIFWDSDCGSEAEESKDWIAEQLYAQMLELDEVRK
jgi:hypothetical protein